MTQMRPLVIIPTYNEAENIERILRRIAEVAARSRRAGGRRREPGRDRATWSRPSPPRLPDVHLMARAGKSGLGSAYRAGFAWGLRAGLRRPDRDGRGLLPRPGRAAGPAGPAEQRATTCPSARVTCRAAPFPTGPATATCSPGAATAMPRLVLGLGVADSTAGFRAYGADIMRKLDLEPDPGRGLRLPDRDDLPGQAGRGGDRRGPDPLRRPGGGRVEDVVAHRGRGAGARDLVGIGAARARAACGDAVESAHGASGQLERDRAIRCRSA